MTLSRRSFLNRSGLVGAGLLVPGAARGALDGVCAADFDVPAGVHWCERAPVAYNAPKKLIVVIANGGWDTTYAFDPKTGNPNIDGPEADFDPKLEGDVETTQAWGRPVPDDLRASPGAGFIFKENLVKRGGLSRFCERWWQDTAVINGMWTGSIVHQPCRIRMLTGTTASYNADFATIFGFEHGADLPLGSFDFSGLSYSGQLAASTGRIGFNAQIKTLLDPATVYAAPSDADYTLPIFRRDSLEEKLVREVLEQRVEEFRDARSGKFAPRNELMLNDMLSAMKRRTDLLEKGADMVADLKLGAEPSMDLQACVAADLLEKGLCSAVTIKHFEMWDTHKANFLQHEKYNTMFTTLDKLMCRLQETDQLKDTLIAVISEMGRTPRLNVGNGKDHWGHTTQLLIGAGIKGGFTYGSTDESQESMPVDITTGELIDEADGGELLKYDSFVSGVLQTAGIDAAKWLPLAVPFTGATAV